MRDQVGAKLWPVHRLDRASSGVLLFALDATNAAALQISLREGTKRYLTLVRGLIEPEGTIDRPLKDDRGVPRDALTRWRRREELDGFSLVDVTIETGRRHQIRRHFAHLAHQIVGDSSYGKGRINRWLREAFGLPRLFLHAEEVTIAHPTSGEPMTIQAPLADDLSEFLDRFRRRGDAEVNDH